MNNRELATFIILGAFFVFALFVRDTRKQLPSLAKLLFSSTITVMLVPFAALVLGAAWVADRVGLWTSNLIGATILWFLLVGFAWFLNLNDAGKDPDFFKKKFVATLGLTALLEFFLNAHVMSLPLELIVQGLLLTLVMLNVVASANKEQQQVASCTSYLLGLGFLALLIYSLVAVVTGWDTLDKQDLVNALLMPIWMTAISIPLLYLYALYMGYEALFRRLKFSNDDRKPTWRARLGMTLGLRGALVDVAEFRGPEARAAARSTTATDARTAVGRFRMDRTADKEARAAARHTLETNAGVPGVDESGLIRDRREFAETKGGLDWLATCHMGWYRNEDRPDEYRSDLLEMLESVEDKRLQFPTDEPIRSKVRKDGQAWFAYRRTPSGHVFGIGASGPPPSKWHYDGTNPPTGFPSQASKGWTDFMSPDRPEWRPEPKV